MSEKNRYSYLGVDTSNYTTSVGIVDSYGGMRNYRKLLPVRLGEKGLRQSEALFLHIKQFDEIFTAADVSDTAAVGVSCRPCGREGSYMPCFLAGLAFARVCAHSLGVPVYEFSHQQGHVAAGVLSSDMPAGKFDEFLTFHASGGTMELLAVRRLTEISVIGQTLDLTCGQLIDRLGVRLGYPFPAGAQVEQCAAQGTLSRRPKVCLKGLDCCMSGFENKAYDLIRRDPTGADACRYVLAAVADTVSAMICAARREYGGLACLFVGGVMRNEYIRRSLEDLGDVYFASQELSSDNAVGTAYLAKLKHEGVIT